MHLLHFALFQQGLPLWGVDSIETMVRQGRAHLEKGDANYLLGMGWNQETMAEGRMPNRQDMDRISTEVPVCLLRTCAHVACCNSVMLEQLQALNADLCMSCGTCSFVCPAKRPLAPSIALAKIMMKNGGKK